MRGPWDPFADVSSPPPDPALPEIVLLAGFLGLNLARPDGRRVWLTPEAFALEDVAGALHLDAGADPLVPDGLNRVVYGDLVRDLRLAGFAVHALDFDFRRPVRDIAANLAAALATLGPDRRFVFVSHSMGALVAAVYPYVDPAWRSRVAGAIFLGGTLAGSFEVVKAALGQHPILARLALLSLPDTQADFAASMRTWPGMLDMLPDPALSPGGADAFDAASWPPSAAPAPALLAASRETRRLVEASPLFTLPCAQLLSLRFATTDAYAPGTLQPGHTGPGDGMVPARTASFGGMPVYRVDLPHTILPLDPKAIRGIAELAATGTTSLDRVTPEEIAGTEPLMDATLGVITEEYMKSRIGQAEQDGLSLVKLLLPTGCG
jgi:pimeloyl-ACP methyl ester carboxylesterase